MSVGKIEFLYKKELVYKWGHWLDLTFPEIPEGSPDIKPRRYFKSSLGKCGTSSQKKRDVGCH